MFTASEHYDGSHLYRGCGALLRDQRPVRPLLRKAVVGTFMENLIVGLVALLLFVYLFLAMIRPEKF